MASVSIGLPVYNGEQFIAEAIESILAQDFRDFEFIISDNASTDSTQSICNSYARRDDRIKYSRLPNNLGAARNYNRVFALSSGKLFKWAAHDDVLHPKFIGECVKSFELFSVPPSIIYPQAEFIDEGGEVIGRDLDNMHADSQFSAIRAFQVLQSMNQSAAIFGLFWRENLKRTRLIGSYVGSDYTLLLESSLLGKIIQLDGIPMFQRRIHPRMSRKSHASKAEALRWFDPTATSKLSIYQKLYIEYLKGLFGCQDIGIVARGLCTATAVSSIAISRGRVVAGRWRRQLRSKLA